MRFGPNVVEHAPFSIPMIGNTATGYVIGLTPEGAAVCHRMFAEDVPEAEVAAVNADLPAHLRRGGFVVEDVEADDVTLGKGVEGVERAEGVGAGNAAAAASAPSASAVPAPLQSAYLHVTHHCNLNCIGCYSAVDARWRALPARRFARHCRLRARTRHRLGGRAHQRHGRHAGEARRHRALRGSRFGVLRRAQCRSGARHPPRAAVRPLGSGGEDDSRGGHSAPHHSDGPRRQHRCPG